MNKYGIKVSEEQNKPELDVSISSGMFITKTEIEFPNELREKICMTLDKAGYSMYHNLKETKFILCCEQDINNRYDSVFGESYFEAIAPAKSEKYISYINDFDKVLLRNFDDYTEIKNSAKTAVSQHFGDRVCEEAYSLDEKVKCLCDIAQYVLDRQTNEERFVRYFGGGGNNLSFALTLSLDSELDDVYNIKIHSFCEGEVGTGYVNDINGVDELSQTLMSIARGSCKVMAEEYSDKPITCVELYTKTVEKYNRLQAMAHKQEMGKD